ncbi:MAG: FecR domain-containing protein [Planctomycetota bacterium]
MNNDQSNAPDSDSNRDELLLKYLDGNATPDEAARAAELLRTDRDARDFVRMVAEQAVAVGDMERVLRAGENRTAADISKVAAARLRSSATTSWPWVLTSLAASLMLVGLLGFRFQANRPIVKITGSNGPLHWTGDGGIVVPDVESGQWLKAGTLESLSTDSWVALEFADGSTVTLTGHSVLTFSGRSQKTLHLRQGNMSADVKKQAAGKPMRIHTPTASLEVLGTQFNVGTQLSSTVCTVNEGCVRVTRLADGKSAEVAADQQVVAAASRVDELEVLPQSGEVNDWQSDLPLGIAYGKWDPMLSQLKAAPMLWKHKEKSRPWLLYLASLRVARENEAPVALQAGSRFLIRGKMEKSADLLIGLTTTHLKGGFAGKHIAFRKAESLPVGEPFELVVNLDEFKPKEPEQPKSPAGLGLHDCWCLTINNDAGLTIQAVELLPNSEGEGQ